MENQHLLTEYLKIDGDDEQVFFVAQRRPWSQHQDIDNYIAANKIPAHFSYKERKFLVEKSFHFSWIDNLLFYTGPDQVMTRCVREDETYDILHACHNEPFGGHFTTKSTALKILKTSYYWPTLHKDAANYTRKCDKSQRMGQPIRTDEMPLNPQMALTPFDKWGMDFIGPIDPPSNGKSYILVCIDYLTRWVEAKL